MKNIILTLQNKSAHAIPHKAFFALCAKIACQKQHAQLTIRLVDENESAQTNAQFRNKNSPTNVLSFPYETRRKKIVGDLLLCPAIVEKEAQQQHKTLHAHYAHLIIHGILHLQGFDHQNEDEAQIMENLEIRLLKKLGFANPYL